MAKMKAIVSAAAAALLLTACEKTRMEAPSPGDESAASDEAVVRSIPVTMENYNQAVAAKYMGNWDKRGADRDIVHLPVLVPAGDKAPVVRMNQDSLYSSAIARADESGEVHVRIDEGANVYVSVHVLDENSASPAYFVGAGEHSVKVDTEWSFIIFRAGVEDKSDLSDALAAQPLFHVDFSANEGRDYMAAPYDVEQRQALTKKLKAEFLESGQDFVYVGGQDHDVDPLRIARSNAQGWGGMPVELGVSNIYRNTAQFDGSVCQRVIFEEPDNKYFTSITLYDEVGYMIDSSRFSINSYEWTRNSDGNVTVHFNCGDDAVNNLSSAGQDFNYTIRNYGVSQRVVDDEFGGREPTIVGPE
jgi:hypothetical protein